MGRGNKGNRKSGKKLRTVGSHHDTRHSRNEEESEEQGGRQDQYYTNNWVIDIMTSLEEGHTYDAGSHGQDDCGLLLLLQDPHPTYPLRLKAQAATPTRPPSWPAWPAAGGGDREGALFDFNLTPVIMGRVLAADVRIWTRSTSPAGASWTTGGDAAIGEKPSSVKDTSAEVKAGGAGGGGDAGGRGWRYRTVNDYTQSRRSCLEFR
ncbi:hypothetical protein NL676_027120 [Syzygium grande]|nr:hypothetical protein NL676_027120 [Syzygium grande]